MRSAGSSNSAVSLYFSVLTRNHSSGLWKEPYYFGSARELSYQGSSYRYTAGPALWSCVCTALFAHTPVLISIIRFHFDTAAGGGAVQPCEAAYLAAIDSVRGGAAIPPKVTVLVMCAWPTSPLCSSLTCDHVGRTT